MRIIAIVSAVICMVLLATASWSATGDSAVATSKTVNAIYPGLASGALTHATLGDLDGNQVLKSASLTITREDLEKATAEIPESAREELRNNQFFLLEQQATGALLTRLAREEVKTPPEAGVAASEDKQVQSYLKGVVADVKVSDTEVAKFYEENKDMCGGAALDKVREDLRQYVLQEKQQEAVEKHIRTLGQRQPIVVSATWTKEQAVLAMDNPVDKARRSGRPSLVDFGADGCRPCDMMAPILKDLRSDYEGKMNVEFVHVREKPVLAARYGIQAIPVQVLFDKDGKEVWRHMGYIPREDLEGKFAQVGLK